MRTFFALLMFGALVVAILSGCGLSKEQTARIEDLAAQNEALYKAQAQLVKDAEAGVVDPVKVAAALAQISAQVKKNIDEIKSIKATNDTMSVITTILALFGRTALHAVAGSLPTSGAAGALGTGLTFLLGGSATAAKKEDD